MTEHNAKMLADRLLNSALIQVLTATFGPKGSKLNYILEDTGLSESAIKEAIEVLKAYDLLEVLDGGSEQVRGRALVYRSRLQKIEILIVQGHANLNIVTAKETFNMTLTTKELANEISFMKGLQDSIRAAFKDTYDYARAALLESIKAEVLAEVEKRDAAQRPGPKPAAPKKPKSRYFCSQCKKKHNLNTGQGKEHLKFKVEGK